MNSAVCRGNTESDVFTQSLTLFWAFVTKRQDHSKLVYLGIPIEALDRIDFLWPVFYSLWDT